MKNGEPPILEDYYSALYRYETSDSPDLSRQQISRSVRNWMLSHPEGGNIVDIGSGPQSIEGTIRIDILNNPLLRSRVDKYKLFSMDLADIAPERLLRQRAQSLNLHHTRADARNLPLSDCSINLAVSNMCLDFVGDRGFQEVARVLEPNGTFIFTLHHPSLWKGVDLENPRSEVASFWRYLRDQNLLFENEDRVSEELYRNGLLSLEVKLLEERLSQHSSNTFWYVEGIRQ